MVENKDKILDLFEVLNNNSINYVLLRNISEEIPCNYTSRKDIDLLINKDSKQAFNEVMKKNGWKRCKHPWDFGDNFVFLYALDKFEFYNKDNINLDICFQLCCRSINNGEWIPVDQLIQKSVWENKTKNKNWNWYEMCPEDQIVHLLTRCIFDKKNFSDSYVETIKQLMPLVNISELENRLNVVFFSYTPVLLHEIENNNFGMICEKYMSFKDY